MECAPLRSLEGGLDQLDFRRVPKRCERELRHRLGVVGIGGNPSERERKTCGDIYLAKRPGQLECGTLRGLHLDPVRRADPRREVGGGDAEASWAPPSHELSGVREALDDARKRRGNEPGQLERQSV